MSHDAEFLKGKNTKDVMALRKYTVPYFDLAKYGLEDFYFMSPSYDPGSQGGGTVESAKGHITMLHLYMGY